MALVVPVTLRVPIPSIDPPVVGSLVNAASQTQGAVAPGEIITLFGSAMGPDYPAGLILDANGKVATQLSGTRVLFDSTPAPLIYASASQINAIVPYEVANNASAKVELEYNGVRSTAVAVPIAATAPAIFAVLNEDYSTNDPSNPAARGSVIQIYGTGEGQTSPPGVTGSIIHDDLKKPVELVAVTIGGVDAPVLYAGSAADSVAGLFQVNVLVPQEVGNGPSVPVILTVGGRRSQGGMSIAVR